jgi:hypothetical protein
MHQLSDLGSPGATPQDRLRRLPAALLLTAGYFASQLPVVSDLLRRLD